MTEKKLKKESANDIKIGMVARKETILIMKKHILNTCRKCKSRDNYR